MGASVLLWLVTSCVSTEARVRVVTRAGALRDAVVVPATLAPGLQVAIGREAATDSELLQLEQDLKNHISARLEVAGPTATPRVGRLFVVRARVRAAPGRQQHRYRADCRLRLDVDGAVVAEAEADVLRLVQARNLSLIELERLRDQMKDSGGRIPLLSSDDVHEAVLSACSAAFDAVAFDARPEDAAIDDAAGPGFSAQERSLSRKEQRRRAIDKLDRSVSATSAKAVNDVAAALIDLAAVGVLGDAPRVAAHLYDESALVRRAAEQSFAALCAGQAVLAPSSPACARPAPPPPPPPPEDDDDDDAAAIRRAPADPVEIPELPSSAPAPLAAPAPSSEE